MLAITAKENVVIKGKKSVTNKARKATNNPEIIIINGEQEQKVKSGEYCAFKCKDEVPLQRHQRSVHFRCHACNMVAVSMKHLNVHKNSAHPKSICDPCGVSFRDEMRCDVHILKEHTYQCEECRDKYTKEANLKIHIVTKHPKEMKCIVCEFQARNADEITKHYEAVHLNTKDNEVLEVAKLLKLVLPVKIVQIVGIYKKKVQFFTLTDK